MASETKGRQREVVTVKRIECDGRIRFKISDSHGAGVQFRRFGELHPTVRKRFAAGEREVQAIASVRQGRWHVEGIIEDHRCAPETNL
jgi:hypothetical protein